MYDSDDDDDDDEYNIGDDNNLYNDDYDEEEEHISKLINNNTSSSRIRHNRHHYYHHHHHHQNDLSFLSQAELNFFTGANRFNRTNNTNINTSSSSSSSSSSSNNNSNSNSRSNSISHLREISFPRGLRRLHRDGPRVDELIQKNKRFSMDDKHYTLKDSLLFTLQHLNSSILLLLENDCSNTNGTIVDDDSLSELLLDLYDDILTSISDNDKCSNDDSIENQKHNDDDNNTFNFRNIAKKIFEEFDIDPIIGIERFKFDLGINSNSNSNTNNNITHNDKKNEINNCVTNYNDHIIDINDSIKVIIEILPILSPSLTLRLLSHYHWDINTLIDDFTINNITTNIVQSFKIKGDNTNEKCACNSCYNYNNNGEMFSLTCGHYFCRSCWSNSINKIDIDINSNCQCLHNYCSISITSDFVDAIVGVGHKASSIVLEKEIALLSSSYDMYRKYHYDNYPSNSDKLLSFQKTISCSDPDICLSCSSPYHYPATCVMMLHWSSKSMSSYNGFTCQTTSSPIPSNKSGNVTPNRSTSSNPFLHTPTTPNREGYVLSNPPYRDLFQSYLDFFTSANGKIAELFVELGLIHDSDMSNAMRKQDSDSIGYARISLSAWQVISLASRFLAYVQVFLNYHQSIPLLLQLSLISFQESVSKLYITINHTTWDKDKDKNKIYETISAIKKRLFTLHNTFFSNQ